MSDTSEQAASRESFLYDPALQDAIELHVHGAPSKFPRSQNIWDIAADAKAAGMTGFVLKAHEWPTGPLAEAVRIREPELQIFGGLVCNEMAGGLSAAVVETQLQCPATKIIWMPTIGSQAHQISDFAHAPTKLFGGDAGGGQSSSRTESGLVIQDKSGNLLPVVHDILQLIADHDAVLATGHLSPAEVDIVVDAALEHHIAKILIQHVDVAIVPIPRDQQQRLAAKGAILEKCYLACTDFGANNVPIEQMAASIQEIGAGHCVLVTDYGQAHNIPPVQALSNFAAQMRQQGIGDNQLEHMLVTNPHRLLGI